MRVQYDEPILYPVSSDMTALAGRELRFQQQSNHASCASALKALLVGAWVFFGGLSCARIEHTCNSTDVTTAVQEGRLPTSVNLYWVDSTNRYNCRETYWAYRNADGEEVKHGQFVGYYPDGVLEGVLNYKHGVLDGRCTQYDFRGQLVIEGQMRNGKPWSGEIGIIDSVWKYKNGLPVRRVEK